MIVFYTFKQKAVHTPLYVLRKNGEQEENVTHKELAVALKLQKRSPRCSYTQSARFVWKVTCAQKPPVSSTRPRRMLSTTPETDFGPTPMTLGPPLDLQTSLQLEGVLEVLLDYSHTRKWCGVLNTLHTLIHVSWPDFMMEMFGKQQTNLLQFELWVEVTDYLHQSRVAGIHPSVAEGTAATVLWRLISVLDQHQGHEGRLEASFLVIPEDTFIQFTDDLNRAAWNQTALLI